jgi:hypothetical protein
VQGKVKIQLNGKDKKKRAFQNNWENTPRTALDHNTSFPEKKTKTKKQKEELLLINTIIYVIIYTGNENRHCYYFLNIF